METEGVHRGDKKRTFCGKMVQLASLFVADDIVELRLQEGTKGNAPEEDNEGGRTRVSLVCGKDW